MSNIIPFPRNMEQTPPPKRKRSMTSIALNWLSERMSRADELKEAINSGTYQIPIDQVAKAIVHPIPADNEISSETIASTERA